MLFEEAEIDFFAVSTENVIADLEKGEPTWRKPWIANRGLTSAQLPLNRYGMPYLGIDVLQLWRKSFDAGYQSPYWMTDLSARIIGGNVKNGEKGEWIRVNVATISEFNSKKKIAPEKIWGALPVFNTEQIEGIPEIGPSIRKRKTPDFDSDIKDWNSLLNKRAIKKLLTNKKQDENPWNRQLESMNYSYRDLSKELIQKINGTYPLHPSAFKMNKSEIVRKELLLDIASCFLSAELHLTPPTSGSEPKKTNALLREFQKDKYLIATLAGDAQNTMTYLKSIVMND